MDMYNIKLLAKNNKELETLTIRIHSQNTGMEFAIGKCAMLIMSSGKQEMMEIIEQTNQEHIRTHEEKETYKYSGIFETSRDEGKI